MPERARQLHEQWVQLDEHARDAERELAREWEDYFAGKCAAPAATQVEAARQRRERASEKLAELMKYMNSTTPRRTA